jgi:hypothetical protein
MFQSARDESSAGRVGGCTTAPDLLWRSASAASAAMPQDSPAQAIVRGALARFPSNLPADFQDHALTLSGVEIQQIKAVLQEFVRVPSEPAAGD